MLAQNRQQTGKSRPDDPTNTSIFAFDWCLHLFATTCASELFMPLRGVSSETGQSQTHVIACDRDQVYQYVRYGEGEYGVVRLWHLGFAVEVEHYYRE